jgi:ABC-2 type transport system permease protein
MFEITRYLVRRRLRGTAALAAMLSLLGAGTVGLFPSVEQAGVDLDAYVESLPPAIREAFGLATLTSIEGFLAGEFYHFAFVLLLGAYAAYLGGRVIAAEVETGRIDLVLAGPVPRWRVVVERYLAVVASLVVVDAVVAVAVVAAIAAIGESIDLGRLLAVHLLAVPYLSCCVAIGLVPSVLTDRADTAGQAGLGAVFALFLLDGLTAPTEYEWLGAVSPMRGYDPTVVLVEGTVDFAAAALLLAAAVAGVAVAVRRFRRNDI